MKAPRRKALFRTLSPSFPNYCGIGKLFVETPIGDMLNGFAFDDSSYDTNWVRVYALILPLYVPTQFLHLGFSLVIGGPNKTWDFQTEGIEQTLTQTMQNEGLLYLSRFDTPIKLAKDLAECKKAPENLHVMEAVAYSLAVSEKWLEADEALARFLRRLERVEEHNESTIDMKQRAELLHTLIMDNPEQALAQLQAWREQTLANLKLP